jgi:hypothetical protein
MYGIISVLGLSIVTTRCVWVLTGFDSEEINRGLKSGNACYHSLQKLLSSSLLSRNVKIKVHKTIILPVVLYGRVAQSLILKEEHRLRMLENRVLKKILGFLSFSNTDR